MATVLAPAGKLVRIHGRGLLLSILEKELILTRIKVFDDGRFLTEIKDWSAYWKPLYELDQSETKENLDELRSAWCNYIHSGFSSVLRREFCFRYFLLLDAVLFNFRQADFPDSWVDALQATLGFECFGITPVTSQEVLGAGICTLRNPCYLLAKLKMPDAMDGAQFLPIITVAGASKAELFYHYRQYTLSKDSPLSLLVYPAVPEAKRSASFKLISSFAGRLTSGIDPWTRERAQHLLQHVFQPIIQANSLAKGKTPSIEFVDIGAGSGSLVSTICRKIYEVSISTGFSPKFRIWSVDLEPADPARFFRAKSLREVIDSLTYIGDDYRRWLSKSQPLPPSSGIRIALVSKLLDVTSRFFVRGLTGEEMRPFMSRISARSNLGTYLPFICLAPNGNGAEALKISNAHIDLKDGKTFAQISLSEFYKGLYFISAPNNFIKDIEKCLFLPIRSFNSECLITSDKRSVIHRLSQECDYTVIEDADLRPQELVEHMKSFSLSSIAVQDLTRALRLIGNHAYVIWSKAITAEPSLLGERIW